MRPSAVDVRDMRDPSPSDPLPRLLDELLGDDAADPAVDARVRAVLCAAHERFRQAPDEVTRRRHLSGAHRARRRVAARRRLGRVARRGAVAAIVLYALAAAGLLPDGLQRTVADAGTVVGVRLPSPGPSAPAGGGPDAQLREDVDGRPPPREEDVEETSSPPAPEGPEGQDDGASAHAGDRRPPPPAREHASERATEALAAAGPAEPPAERSREAVAAGRPEDGTGRREGPTSGTPGSSSRPRHTDDRSPDADAPPGHHGDGRGDGPGDGPPDHRGDGPGDGPPDHARGGGPRG